jgi:hypothetical protein
MLTTSRLNVCALICMLALPTYAFAEGPPESGFFDDYSRLQAGRGRLGRLCLHV